MKEIKLTKKDIGFYEELFELCKNLVSIESHAFGSYISTKEDKWLELNKIIRKMRTKYLSLLTKKDNAQGWCISKHICECAMRLQECYTRFLSTGQMQEAQICAEDSGDLYLLFLEINGLDKEVDIKEISSA